MSAYKVRGTLLNAGLALYMLFFSTLLAVLAFFDGQASEHTDQMRCQTQDYRYCRNYQRKTYQTYQNGSQRQTNNRRTFN